MHDLQSHRGRRRPARGRALLAGLFAWLALAAPAMAIDPDDLLPVDEAFALTVRPGGDGIALHWEIADGYYLYRHRISAQTDAGFAAQALQLPPGEAHEDEFFGRVETYRDQLDARLPGQPLASRTTLIVKYQGCADLGICYPPQTRKLTVHLPQTPSPRASGNGKPLVAFGAGGASGNPLLGGSGAGADPLPLPAEQAFGFEAIAGDGNTLLLRFTPADGYYLYRDRTTLDVDADGIRVGTPQWPEGVAHFDEHFGDVVVYFDQITVPLPLRREHARPAQVRLTATFQGCQTGGICYPPMTRAVDIDLPAGTVTSAEQKPSPSRGEEGRLRTTGSRPDERPQAVFEGRNGLGGDGVASATAGAATVGGASAPTRQSPAADATDSGEPTRSFAGINPDGIDATAPSAAADPQVGAEAPPTKATQAEDSRLAAALSGPSRWWTLLGFFAAGLGLAFTPCVLPMIPILSGLIAGASAGGKLGAGRALGLSLVYVLANALVFTVAGVVAGLVGANVQIAFQNPWVLAAFAALFVALALSSFGVYELQLPAALRTRLGALSDRQRGGSLAGVAIMGALSALIVGPCVAPPLAAAVLYIGQTQDPAFGGAALFLLAMGMGVPLLAFGVAAGRGLPTTGPWMVAVQRAFGFVFLGLAVWMLSRVLPGPISLALWGALLVGAAAMLALGALRSRRDGLRVAGWAAAALFGLAGAAQVVGAMAGSHDPLQPLAGLRGHAEARELPFRRIKSLADLQREITAAQVAGKPLLLDFYADWCVSCKEMEKYTFPEPKVQQALAGFVLLKADVTANDAVDQELMKTLGIIGPPATLYYIEGAERRELRLFGFEEADAFAQRAARAQAALP